MELLILPFGLKRFYFSSSSLALCSKGSYSKDGLMPLNGCSKCPQGSFQDLDGKSYCKICPQRGETPGDGSTDESNCYGR